ncbi:MAG: adenylate/guanylate cyclase domain-containing protein [Mariniblastus sp.]
MLELIAQGPNLDSRWRRQLPNQTIELGRTTQSYRVPWDSQVSRCHVKLIVGENEVHVEKLPEAVNPVFYSGQQEDSFILRPGEHFVIGATTFTLAADRAFVSLDVPDPISQKTFSPEFLRKMPYRDADRRIDVLNRIPEVISSAGNVKDLLIGMVNTLMAGIAPASTIGIVRLESADDAGSGIGIVHWDRRGYGGGDFQPSESLIRLAIEREETTLHIWNQRKRGEKAVPIDYTYDYENDWAFVSPISSLASPGWGIYVAGTNRMGGSSVDSGSGEADLQGDIKFCELVGATLKNLLTVKQLERQQASLRTFFSPIVMEAFVGRDADEVLAPRKCDVAVLFSDLRGFAKKSERMADNLLELLARVSDSLGIMTREILEHGGVIGDFHGDSAMGFWGWPLEPASETESAVAAVFAALEIQKKVETDLLENPSLGNFQIGLGLASGNAVAGKIGTRDQVKVTVFGPVVNLASRLEGMTRWLNSYILADAETVRRIKKGIPLERRPVTRCLGNFQPFGMESSFEVFQVFPCGAIPDTELQLFANALKCFQNGDWTAAIDHLSKLPEQDSGRQVLTNFMVQNSNSVPVDWRGVVQMKAK